MLQRVGGAVGGGAIERGEDVCVPEVMKQIMYGDTGATGEGLTTQNAFGILTPEERFETIVDLSTTTIAESFTAMSDVTQNTISSAVEENVFAINNRMSDIASPVNSLMINVPSGGEKGGTTSTTPSTHLLLEALQIVKKATATNRSYGSCGGC